MLLATAVFICPIWQVRLSAIPDNVDPDSGGKKENAVAHPEQDNVSYKVLAVILMTWLGLAAFLLRVDLRIRNIEKRITDQKISEK